MRFSWLESLRFTSLIKYTEKLHERVIKLICNSLFQGNYCIVRNLNILGTYIRTAFSNVAKAYTVHVFQVAGPVFNIKRMHFQSGGVDHVPGACKFLMEMMFT